MDALFRVDLLSRGHFSFSLACRFYVEKYMYAIDGAMYGLGFRDQKRSFFLGLFKKSPLGDVF